MKRLLPSDNDNRAKAVEQEWTYESRKMSLWKHTEVLSQERTKQFTQNSKRERVKFAGIEFIEGSHSHNQLTALLPTSQCSTLKRTNDHLISGYSAVMKRQCQAAKCHTQVIVRLN